MQFAIIFALIFAVLAVAVFAFRRLSGQGQSISTKVGGRGRQPRLGVVDIYELDRQRQLILLRRDDVEHLLLVGGPNDVVVERNIARGVAARLAEGEPAPSEAAIADPARFPPAFEPAFEMPVAVPPPPDSPARPDPVARPHDPPISDLAAPDLFAPDDIEPQTARPSELRPARPGLSEASAPPVAPSPSRPARRLSPTLANLVPSVINLVPGAAKRAPTTDGDSAVTAAGVTDAVPPGESARPVDPAILSDMARQLEQVVRRPAAPAMPAFVLPPAPPAPAEPVAAEPVVTEPVPAPPPPAPPEPEAVDPMAAGMAETAETPERDDALFEPAAPEPERPTPTTDRPIPPVRRPTPTPDAPVSAPVAPEPRPLVSEPAPVVVEPAVAPAKPAAPDVVAPPAEPAKQPTDLGKSSAGTSPNPFSVEEIEAEFARLLGRSLDKKG
ncbi:hypothetical protein [Methylobacterium gossipiicola]|uniref:Flagellar biosynthesis protein, FliO n=1 Tax=Methylobacterium gossipiicola TaxID=582675 RepID=A0A1I2TLZ6_9HYPH|nr:hypothetical protein [Methylobacterium gossipiicola]SFG64387.1 hypothetical protein SAMN05192565_107108 [Methylobacterium gossipiicola]